MFVTVLLLFKNGYSQTSSDPIYIYSDKVKNFYVLAYLEKISSKGNCQSALNYVIKTKGICPENIFLKWDFTYYDCNKNEKRQQNTIRLYKNQQAFLDNREFKLFKIKSLYEGTASVRKVTPPENFSISGPELVNEGESASLYVSKESEYRNVKWLWYQNGETKPFETGTSVSVTPDQTTRYYLKAEQEGFLSGTKNFLLNVKLKPEPPKDFFIEGPDMILEGDTTSLRVNTKEIATDVVWSWYKETPVSSSYIGKGNSVSVDPAETTKYFVQGNLNGKKSIFKEVIVRVKDMPDPPTDYSIKGPTIIKEGAEATLEVDYRGNPDGIKWLWFKEGETSNFAEGKRIVVKPTDNTKYSVRSVIYKKKSPSRTYVLNVQVASKSPLILGNLVVCNGASVKENYRLDGGRLGTGSKQWLWYKGTCGSGVLIGSGNQVQIPVPDKTSKFYIKPDADNDFCEEFTIEVVTPPIAPLKINSTSFICDGQELILNVEGGKLKEGQKWVWYSQQTGTNQRQNIGYGAQIKHKPMRTTTYYVGVETDFCKSGEVSQTVEVRKRPYYNGHISIPSTKKRHYTLEAIGIPTNEGYKAVWYRDKCGERKIGEGNSISIKANKKGSNIYMRPEGDCDTLQCRVQQIKYVKSKPRKFIFINGGIVNNDYSNFDNGMISIGSRSFYVRAKINFNTIKGLVNKDYSKPGISYETSNSQIVNFPSNSNSYYNFNGLVESKRESFSIGFMIGPRNLKWYVGGGYGKRELLWGVDLYQYNPSGFLSKQWAKNRDQSIAGVEGETGVFVNLWKFNIMAGSSIIYSPSTKQTYIDAHIGLGITFSKK